MEDFSFHAELQKMPDMDATYICIPENIHSALGGKKRIKVVADINGVIYRGSITDMGIGMMLGVTQDIRKKIKKNPGDIITIRIRPDLEERVVEVPGDLATALDIHPEARYFFDKLSFTNRKEYVRWITDSKREETRTARVEKTVQKLLEGKRNPSEK